MKQKPVKKVYYEGHFLFWLDHEGKTHQPKARAGSASSTRCEDCELRGALTHHGLPTFCSECRASRSRGKTRCAILTCANGCEACGGRGRVPLR